MKNILLTAVALLVSASLGLAADSPRTLSVTGTAQVSVAPDICYIDFVITTNHKTSASAAYRSNNEDMTDIRDGIFDLDVEKKDVQTRDFSIAPQYHWDDDRDRSIFDGYEVSHTLHVKLRDIERVSDVLDAAVSAGATRVSSVTFTVENPKKYLGEARIEAIKAARAKAETIAETAGVIVLKPLTISEQEPYSWNRYAAQANVSLDAMQYHGGGASLAPGQFELSHTVHITYEIR